MIRVLFEGEEACFTRPELKVERVSYEVPTPSAIRGMLEAIYWHPGIKWVVERIYILNPVKMYSIKRNEVAAKLNGKKVLDFAQGKESALPYVYADKERQQRSSRVLRDVRYVVDAHFDITSKANASDNPGKIQDIITRRVQKGQCFHTPYLGTREFPAVFKPWEGDDIPTIDMDKDMGFMLYDIDFEDDMKPMFFHCIVEKGVIDLHNVEILK